MSDFPICITGFHASCEDLVSADSLAAPSAGRTSEARMIDYTPVMLCSRLPFGTMLAIFAQFGLLTDALHVACTSFTFVFMGRSTGGQCHSLACHPARLSHPARLCQILRSTPDAGTLLQTGS